MPRWRYAKRLKSLDRETSFEILARARALEAEGHEIIHLEIGEPDFETPQHVKQAAQQAIDAGYTHYGPSAGLPSVREAIAQYVSRDRGVSVNPDQVVVTPGGKSLIFFVMMALIEPGDEVLFPDPGFPNYEMTIEFVGGKPVPIPLDEKSGFSIDVEHLESLITKKTKLCILNSPHNPTGAVLPRETMEAILEIANRHDIAVLSDEIYSKIVYQSHEDFYSLPGAAERTIMLDGHSKTYAMTGWRLGYGVMPKELATQISRIASDSTSCTCTFTQLAGVAALEGSQESVKTMVEEFRVRRDIIVDGLNRIPGFRCYKPGGAFYVFPNISDTGFRSKELAGMLMEKARVAVLSGDTFGENGEGFLRMSYANSQDNIRRAIDRIADVIS